MKSKKLISTLFLLASVSTALIGDNFIMMDSPRLKEMNFPKYNQTQDMHKSSTKVMGKYWVQIGAYKSQKMATDLKVDTMMTIPNVETFSASSLHKVAVGPFDSIKSAKMSLKNLRSIHKDAFITKR